MKRPQSYIGVSGICTRAEVLAALAAFPDCGRLLMPGVLVSAKTLAGQRNRWWRRYPPVERIAGIFVDDPRCLNLVHFASDEPPDGDTLVRLFELSGPICHGFQFNGAWPYACEIRALHRMFDRHGRDARIVLQVGPRVLGACPTALDIALRLSAHVDTGVATDVLIDASGGTGQPLDVAKAEYLVDYLRAQFTRLGIGIAGGLCVETLPPVAPLIASGVSCDSEGRLRDDADGGGRLVQAKVDAYLAATGKAART